MKLWKQQREAVKRAEPEFALFMEEGTGKTLSYLEIAKKFHCESLLVICPKSLIPMWEEMLNEYGVGYGLHSCRVESYDRAGRRYEELAARNYDAIVLDEASKIKRHKSQRFKNLCKLSKRSNTRVRLLGTGTPIGNGQGTELFCYAKFLFREHSMFGGSFTKFRAKYFEEVWDFEWEPKDGTLEVFERIRAEWSYRVRKVDCFDLPPKLYKRHRLRKLKGISRKAYDAIKKHTIAQVGDVLLDSPMAATKFQKLQQICSGVLYGKTPEPWVTEILDDSKLHFRGILDNPKLEWLTETLPEILAERSGDVLIVGTFTKVLESICQRLEHLKIPFGRYYDKYRDSLKGDWRVMVANCTTIAFGHNLQRLTHIIFYNIPWKAEERRQIESRAHRGGQTKKVTIHDLIGEGIDNYIYESVMAHADVARVILNDIGEEF